MKLNIVPARTGILWVKLGMKTFLKQPLALTGLFFMYFAALLLVSVVPVVGQVLGAILVPAATLGLMAASAEADQGRFPTPTLLVSAFRSGRQRTRSMLLLGIGYAAIFYAMLLLVPEPTVPDAAGGPPQLRAGPGLLVFAVLQLPLLIVFALAPGLVHWHGLGPVKAVFFSLVAFWRNLGAYFVFAATWCLILTGLMLLLGVAFAVAGGAPPLAALSPVVLVIAAMISASLYFTFRDSFHADAEPAAEPAAPGGDSTP